jgi:hypothetical protein
MTPAPNIIYFGLVTAEGATKARGDVYVATPWGTCLPLRPSNMARQWNGENFAWGYQGTGPKCLAHSMIADEFDVYIADCAYKAFEQLIICNWPMTYGTSIGKVQWTYTSVEFRAWMKRWELHQEASRVLPRD